MSAARGPGGRLRRWAAAALVLGATLAHAGDAGGIRDIVLVHGAFTDGSSWSPVIRALQHKGYRVAAVQNPLTSLADDVAATRRVVRRQKGPVLLVGHSWGGVVVSEAGTEESVKGIVYLSALVPDAGESVAGLLARMRAPMEGLVPDQDGLVWLDDPHVYQRLMAGDVPRATVQALAAVQQPMSARAFQEPLTLAAWRIRPTWYLVTEQDHALAPGVQRAIARHIGARVSSLPSSHLSLVSHPQAVADLIDRAARAAGR
ncbi:alpha/beta fold hydrolase [Paracidovorax anthurii]|uniref:Pimeloyl-ACP methyl ester carboxylesterase n=1 Tax=Paracidovorax anthurii TaxID=78229 RepID=A0A328YR88_9BURK|nr:alpha/beta hydrolase [Paracidovorax anthurii]RAR76210.1 pimeloyl-ACP methyl ester carboxylesterase [Paracidovorax anthurii]